MTLRTAVMLALGLLAGIAARVLANLVCRSVNHKSDLRPLWWIAIDLAFLAPLLLLAVVLARSL